MRLKKNKNKTERLEKRQLRTALVIVLFLLSIVTPFPTGNVSIVKANELDDLNGELSDLDGQLKSINDQLAAKQAQKKTLQNEIAIFDGQMYRLQLQINITQTEISKLKAEIKNTEAQISAAEVEIEKQKQILFENLRLLYEEGQTTSIEIVASADNFSEFMDRTEYLKAIQDKISETMDKVEQLKAELESRKADLETKKTEQLSLQNNLMTQRGELNSQRVAKQSLLNITKNEEAAFQNHIASVEKELRKLQSEIWSIINSGNYISLGHVDRGSIVGYEGNTGYSTASHLHFELRNSSGQGFDPLPYLGNKYGQPMASYYVTQGCYGGFSHAGAGGPCGIDMVASAGTAVKAVADGEIIKRVTGRPNTFPWSVEYGNYVIVAHTDGTFSMYAHLQ